MDTDSADSQPDGKSREEGATGTNSSAPTPSPAPAATPAFTTTTTTTPATDSPPATRPPYIPQFTAATQLILKRMKGEPSSLSSALSAASVVAGNIKPSTFEDVKRRLVMGMNTSTSMTMQLPLAPSPPPSLVAPNAPRTGPTPKPAAGMSVIRRISSGLTVSGKPVPPPKPQPARALSSESKVKKLKTTAVTKAASSRRKRVKGEDDGASNSSDMPEASEAEASSSVADSSVLLTTTKSGRQVQKPSTYNPAAADANSRKRGHYGKRTAEQALCKKCTRMHSPASNQMVFCDDCNGTWHQMCHDPWIDNDVVNDAQRAWFCSSCVEKRDRGHTAKRQKVEPKMISAPPPFESWASKTPQQRRAYLMTLSSPALVGMVMHALEIHPDLPIFPNSPELVSHGLPRSLFAGSTVEGLFPRADANPTGQMNFVRKAASGSARSVSSGPTKGKGGKGQKDKEDSQERAEGEDEEESDPLALLWPKPGKGLYSTLPPDDEDAEHLVDDGDYEAFSVIVYDERGRKIEENGMKV